MVWVLGRSSHGKGKGEIKNIFFFFLFSFLLVFTLIMYVGGNTPLIKVRVAMQEEEGGTPRFKGLITVTLEAQWEGPKIGSVGEGGGFRWSRGEGRWGVGRMWGRGCVNGGSGGDRGVEWSEKVIAPKFQKLITTVLEIEYYLELRYRNRRSTEVTQKVIALKF